jgi:hypothetical protein
VAVAIIEHALDFDGRYGVHTWPRAAARTPANSSSGAAALRESDRVIRPLKPGNAGGGKDPDFWCAFEDGKVVVIGDEPENTIKDRRRPRLLYRAAKESDLRV